MLDRGLGEIGYFEKRRVRMISLHRHQPNLTRAELTIERGRISKQGGRDFFFSGPPPSIWCDSLPDLDPLVPILQLEEAIGSFRDGLKVIESLHYTETNLVRISLNEAFASPKTHVKKLWALTGYLETAKGHRFPIGWSGLGSGLNAFSLQRVSILNHFSENLERAQPMLAASLPVTLSQEAAALLIHEAIGHLVEAPHCDEIKPLPLGFRLASPGITLEDAPFALGGLAHYQVDDDNIPVAMPTRVVENGILVEMLHSKASAKAAQTLPTGNGRSASAWDTPIPRISNLCCLPGKSSEKELVAQTEDGLFIHRLANGIGNGVDIQADILLAEKISKGTRTGDYFHGGRLREPINVLTRVRGVGNYPCFSLNGICGKGGQLLFDVGTSAPMIHLSQISVFA